MPGDKPATKLRLNSVNDVKSAIKIWQVGCHSGGSRCSTGFFKFA